MENRDNAYSAEEILEATNHLQDKLGEGLQGAVYRGILRDGTEVAIKALGALEADVLEAFETEVRVGCNWRHPHLCILMGYSVKEQDCYLVYEYLAGGDVAARLAKSDTVPFTGEQRLQVLLDTGLALSYLMNSKPRVFHRDIKTPNILLDKNGVAKVGDFGLSCLSKRSGSVQVKNTAGTIGYADPEYVRTSIVTENSEIYSWSMVALELLTGSPPAIQSNTGVEYLMSRIQGVGSIMSMLDPRAQWAPGAAHSLAELVIRCAGPSSQRPSFIEMVKSMRHIMQSAAATPSLPSVPTPHPSYYANSHEYHGYHPDEHYNGAYRGGGYPQGDYSRDERYPNPEYREDQAPTYYQATVVTNHAVVRDQHQPQHLYPQQTHDQRHPCPQQAHDQRHPCPQQQDQRHPCDWTHQHSQSYNSPERSAYYPRQHTPPPVTKHHEQPHMHAQHTQHTQHGQHPYPGNQHPRDSGSFRADHRREQKLLDPGSVHARKQSSSPRANAHYGYDGHQQHLSPYATQQQRVANVSPRRFHDESQMSKPYYDERIDMGPSYHRPHQHQQTGLEDEITRPSSSELHFYEQMQLAQATTREPVPHVHSPYGGPSEAFRGYPMENAPRRHDPSAYGQQERHEERHHERGQEWHHERQERHDDRYHERQERHQERQEWHQERQPERHDERHFDRPQELHEERHYDRQPERHHERHPTRNQERPGVAHATLVYKSDSGNPYPYDTRRSDQLLPDPRSADRHRTNCSNSTYSHESLRRSEKERPYEYSPMNGPRHHLPAMGSYPYDRDAGNTRSYPSPLPIPQAPAPDVPSDKYYRVVHTQEPDYQARADFAARPMSPMRERYSAAEHYAADRDRNGSPDLMSSESCRSNEPYPPNQYDGQQDRESSPSRQTASVPCPKFQRSARRAQTLPSGQHPEVQGIPNNSSPPELHVA